MGHGGSKRVPAGKTLDLQYHAFLVLRPADLKKLSKVLLLGELTSPLLYWMMAEQAIFRKPPLFLIPKV